MYFSSHNPNFREIRIIFQDPINSDYAEFTVCWIFDNQANNWLKLNGHWTLSDGMEKEEKNGEKTNFVSHKYVIRNKNAVVSSGHRLFSCKNIKIMKITAYSRLYITRTAGTRKNVRVTEFRVRRCFVGGGNEGELWEDCTTYAIIRVITVRVMNFTFQEILKRWLFSQFFWKTEPRMKRIRIYGTDCILHWKVQWNST